MENVFKVWKTSRRLYLELFNKYTIDQLNKIPQGFNNNIIWNIGHIIVAQQSLIYKSSDLPMNVSEELFSRYKPGSKPVGIISQQGIDELRNLLTTLVDQTEKDFYGKKFEKVIERTTSLGFNIASLNDAFEVNNHHEGLHLGYIMSLKKFI